MTLIAIWFVAPFALLVWRPYRKDILGYISRESRDKDPMNVFLAGLAVLLLWFLWPVKLFIMLRGVEPTVEVKQAAVWTQKQIEAFADVFAMRFPKGFPMDKSGNVPDTVHAALGEVPFASRDKLFWAFRNNGIGIVGVENLDTGEQVVLPFDLVEELTGPIILSPAGDETNQATGVFSESDLSSSEDYTFTTSQETWRTRGGRSGVATIKDGIVVRLIVTLMN